MEMDHESLVTSGAIGSEKNGTETDWSKTELKVKAAMGDILTPETRLAVAYLGG